MTATLPLYVTDPSASAFAVTNTASTRAAEPVSVVAALISIGPSNPSRAMDAALPTRVVSVMIAIVAVASPVITPAPSRPKSVSNSDTVPVIDVKFRAVTTPPVAAARSVRTDASTAISSLIVTSTASKLTRLVLSSAA